VLARVQLRRFRCFHDATLRLGPLTILVGPNGSGKTSLLRALDPGLKIAPKDVSAHGSDAATTIVATADDGKSYVRLAGEKPRGERFYSFQFVRFDVSQIRAERQVQEATSLGGQGENVVNVFQTLPRPEQERVVNEYCRLVPLFSDVYARPSTPGNHRLVFQDRWNSSRWYEPGEVSDGSLLVLAFVLLKHQQEFADVIAIDDPEIGIHPYLIARIIGVLRHLTSEVDGKKRPQIVVATHSATVLENATPAEVRFLTRREEGVVIHEAPTSTTEWESAFKEYGNSLADLWLAGTLGGVPGQ
jgi:predicted ATPase